jgi:CBS domain-containing protein
MFETSNLTAADVMTRDVIFVHPHDTLRRVAKIMLDRGISGVPVVDAAGRVAGIVSEADLIKSDANTARSRWWLETLAEGERMSDEFMDAIRTAQKVNRPVSRIMHTELVIVAPETPLAEVADKLIHQNVRRVLVMEKDKLLGIIARRDLVKVLARAK